MIEFQLNQTVCVLRKYIPDYDPARAAYFAAQVGVSIPETPPNMPGVARSLSMMPYSPSGSESYSMRSPIDGSQVRSPSTPPTPYFRPPYSFPPMTSSEKPLNSYPLRRESDIPPRDVESDNGNKGLDPRGINMASPAAIARSFGVTPRLLDDPRYKEPGEHLFIQRWLGSEHCLMTFTIRTSQGGGR